MSDLDTAHKVCTPFSVWITAMPTEDEIKRLVLPPWRYRLWRITHRPKATAQ